MDNSPLHENVARQPLSQSTPPRETPLHNTHQTWTYDIDQTATQPPGLTFRGALQELLETALYILLVFIIVRSMVQNFKIEGSSMEPTLHDEEYILVNKIVYFNFDLNAPLRLLPGYADVPPRQVYPFSLPERGDILVFEYPNDPRKDYIKRVIGLPGDKIRITDGSVYLNDTLLDEPYLIGETMPTNETFCNPSARCRDETIVVPEGTVFVMGDNRGNSSDSREWDSLSLEHIIGKAWLLYYPLDDIGLIQHPKYEKDT